MRSLNWILLLVAGPLLVGLLFAMPPKAIRDETIHLAQAQDFAHGVWQQRERPGDLADDASGAGRGAEDRRCARAGRGAGDHRPLRPPGGPRVQRDRGALRRAHRGDENGAALLPAHRAAVLRPRLHRHPGARGAFLARIGWGAKRRRSAITVAIIAVVVALTFSVEHRFNTSPFLIAPFLRNRLLFAITHSDLVRLLFAGWTAVSALAFAHFPFVPALRRVKIPLYVVAACSLLPLELIEQRYYLPFYAYFMAMRAPLSDGAEWIQLGMSIGLAAAVVYAITHLGVFL